MSTGLTEAEFDELNSIEAGDDDYAENGESLFDDDEDSTAVDYNDYGQEDDTIVPDFMDDTTQELDTVDNAEEEALPVEYGVDFKTGQLTGGKVTGLEAIKVWAWNVLQIERYAYEQFTWNIGNEMFSLIGKSEAPALVQNDMQRMVEDCLKPNKYIKDIDDFTCSISGDTLSCSFTIKTTLGEVELSNVTV